MSINDPKTGQFRSDVQVIHVRVLNPSEGDDYEALVEAISKGLKNKGLLDKYVVAITGPGVLLELDTVESFIEKVGNESDALKNAEVLDNLIEGLTKAREKRWKKADEEKRNTQAPRSF